MATTLTGATRGAPLLIDGTGQSVLFPSGFKGGTFHNPTTTTDESSAGSTVYLQWNVLVGTGLAADRTVQTDKNWLIPGDSLSIPGSVTSVWIKTSGGSTTIQYLAPPRDM